MLTEPARRILQAYRWQRGLGARAFCGAHCRVVSHPALPNVWDVNHVDQVEARNETEIASVLAAMETHFGATPWRVVHTDAETPDAFLARLAFDGFQQHFLTIQMMLDGEVRRRGRESELRRAESDADWREVARLVRENHLEGRVAGGYELPEAFSLDMTASYRAKGGAYPFYLVHAEGEAIGYGACAVAPQGVGMIEDLYISPQARRRGIATGMIAAFADRVRARGCDIVFLGALASESPKRLYAGLGFRPVALSRSWVRSVDVAAAR